MQLEAVQALIRAFGEGGLTSLVYTEGDFHLELGKKPTSTQSLPAPTSETRTEPYAQSGRPEREPSPAAPAPAEPAGYLVASPIVGTFYAAAGPDAPAFVTVGQAVRRGDVLCIVEAMKTMNEIESDRDGVVTAVHARNGALVEYGQPLFTLGDPS